MFKDKVVIITGGAQGIGKCIADEFKRNRANVCTIDRLSNDYFVGDLAEEENLLRFSQKVRKGEQQINRKDYQYQADNEMNSFTSK